jgi:RND family efflux transporter MFP subunit
MKPLISTRARTAAAAMVLAATVAACRTPSNASQNAPPPAPSAPIAIDIVKVIERPLDVQLSLPGELTAYQAVAMFPRVTGFVKAVHVDRGSRVRAGETLVTLEAPELVAQRSQAQSNLHTAESQLAVAQSKAESDAYTLARLKAAAATPGVVAGNEIVIAEKTAEAARHQITAAQQVVEAARQAMNALADLESYLRVTAPFAGVITERNVHPGALVGPPSGAAAAAPLLRLADTSRLRLVVPIPEAYTSDIATGAAIPFSVAAFPGKVFSGTIARISKSVDVTTRTMAVELDVTNPSGLLAPGTFSQVRWPVHRSGPSLFVPSASVATTTDRTFVVRIRNGKAEWVDVRTGLTSGTLVEVFGDLHAGDEVAGRGTDELRPGTEVRRRDDRPVT